LHGSTDADVDAVDQPNVADVAVTNDASVTMNTPTAQIVDLRASAAQSASDMHQSDALASDSKVAVAFGNDDLHVDESNPDTVVDKVDSELLEITDSINEGVTSEFDTKSSVSIVTAAQYADMATSLAKAQATLQEHTAFMSRSADAPSDIICFLQDKKTTLMLTLQKHERELDTAQQISYISAHEPLYDFYFGIQLYMESAFVSARALQGGYVEKNDGIGAARGMSRGSKMASVLARGLKKAVKLIPLVGAFAEALGSVAVSVSEQVAKACVRRIAAGAVSTSELSACMKQVAVLTCLNLHDELLHMSSSCNSQGIRALFQSGRGDVNVGESVELAKKFVSRLLRDMMLDSSAPKKRLPTALDASDKCVHSICSFLLERKVSDFSIDVGVQQRIDAHSKATMPEVPQMSIVATTTSNIAASTVVVPATNAAGPMTESQSFADAAAFEQLRAQHSEMKSELAAMRASLERRKSVQNNSSDVDEDTSIAVGGSGGGDQQAMMSAKSKSKKNESGSTADEEKIARLERRIQELEVQQARTDMEMGGIHENIGRLAVAANVQEAFDNDVNSAADTVTSSSSNNDTARDELFNSQQ
jgi:hypothetical protein